MKSLTILTDDAQNEGIRYIHNFTLPFTIAVDGEDRWFEAQCVGEDGDVAPIKEIYTEGGTTITQDLVEVDILAAVQKAAEELYFERRFEWRD